jgi:hypothetical protein
MSYVSLYHTANIFKNLAIMFGGDTMIESSSSRSRECSNEIRIINLSID